VKALQHLVYFSKTFLLWGGDSPKYDGIERFKQSLGNVAKNS